MIISMLTGELGYQMKNIGGNCFMVFFFGGGGVVNMIIWSSVIGCYCICAVCMPTLVYVLYMCRLITFVMHITFFFLFLLSELNQLDLSIFINRTHLKGTLVASTLQYSLHKWTWQAFCCCQSVRCRLWYASCDWLWWGWAGFKQRFVYTAGYHSAQPQRNRRLEESERGLM